MNLNLMTGISRLKNLPDWLHAPLQCDQVSNSLRLHVQEISSGQLSIRSCTVKRLFLIDDSGYWGGTYQLVVQNTSTGVEQPILLHGKLTAPWLTTQPDPATGFSPIGSSGWRCFLPELNLALEMEPPEKELPALAQLTDREQCRVLMDEVFRANGRLPAGISISACTPHILSYKPGSRCTIRYDLEYQSSTAASFRGPEAVIGKIYRKANKAQNAYEGMLTLWHSQLSKGDPVTIAEPVACLPELKLMLQLTIPGETSLEDLLKAVIDHPDGEAMKTLQRTMQKAASGLAAFHQSMANYGSSVGLEIRFAELHALLQRLAVIDPEIIHSVNPLLTWLENLAATHPADRLVPTHGTFNPEQVLIHGEQIGFIDFDDYCMAEPALDVGLFRAAIKDTGMNVAYPSALPDPAERLARLTVLDEICDVFLAEYERHAALSRERVALWEAVDYLRNCLHYWIKVKPAEPDHAFLVLEQHLQRFEKNNLQKLSSNLTR